MNSPDLIELGVAGKNLASGLATRLRTDVVSGALPPGTRLAIDELRARSKTSLSPLREALSRLQAEGFVVLEDKKGFRVAPVSRANCMEVARLQETLEVKALTESIAHGDVAWEEQIVAAYYGLSRLDRADQRKDGPDVDAWEYQHKRFHAALIGACNMPLLLSFCSSLHDFAARYRRLFLASHRFDPDVPDEHKTIMDAALARRTKEACRALSIHIERTAENILVALDETQSGGAAGERVSGR